MSRSFDPRIEGVVDLLARLTAGEYGARGSRSPADDDVDAVVEGINILAAELEASRADLENRVQQRTAELEQANRDMVALAELGNLLQACESAQEAYDVMRQGLATMFAELSGAFYLYRPSRNMLEVVALSDDFEAAHILQPTACWALRRGAAHVLSGAAALSCSHVRERTGDSLCVPMSAHGETLGLLHLMAPRPDGADGNLLSSRKRRLAMAVAEQSALALANLELRHTLQAQALRDPLTGLHNRRFADAWLEREVGHTDRTGQSIGVIMADLDHFKQVNDVHGHEAGDQLLKAVADALGGALRAGDLPCRYGGEEFLVLLTDIDADALSARAEQLRETIASLHVYHRGAPLPSVTMSAGIATYPGDGRTAAEVVAAADAALYEAKHAGRNRTCAAT